MSPSNDTPAPAASATPATPATPATIGNNNNRSGSNNNNNRSGNRSGNNNRNNNSRRNNNATVVQSTDGAAFEGGCPDISAVVGLRTEKITKKVPFSVFVEKFADFVMIDFKHASDIELCIRYMSDPLEDFALKYKPVPLMEENPSFD